MRSSCRSARPCVAVAPVGVASAVLTSLAIALGSNGFCGLLGGLTASAVFSFAGGFGVSAFGFSGAGSFGFSGGLGLAGGSGASPPGVSASARAGPRRAGAGAPASLRPA